MLFTIATYAPRLILAFAMLLLAACGDDGSSGADTGPVTDTGTMSDSASADGAPNPIPDGAVPPPPDCSPTIGGPRDGSPDGSVAALLIGSRDATGFHAFEEGAPIPFVWGFQGGTMVMPVVRVESSGLMGDPLCVHAQILNEFTDDGPPAEPAELLIDVEMHIRDGAYETDPLFDPLSYDTPEGRPLSLDATISLSGFSVSGSANVVVGHEGDPPPPGG